MWFLAVLFDRQTGFPIFSRLVPIQMLFLKQKETKIDNISLTLLPFVGILPFQTTRL
jgi:hypothetical protein